MSLARWWNPFTRRRRAAPAAAASPATKDPLDRSTVAAVPVAIDAAAPEELRGPQAIDQETPGERHVRFFCWMVGVPATPLASASPLVVIARVMERLDQVIASESLRAGLLPRAPHVVPQLMRALRDEH